MEIHRYQGENSGMGIICEPQLADSAGYAYCRTCVRVIERGISYK
jgi:hypothetical protein